MPARSTTGPAAAGSAGSPVAELPASRWRASPRRLAALALGLVLFGTGEGLVVAAGLGNSPWTVLAEGLAVHTPLGVGSATVVISGLVLLAWIPLRQRPGLGTIANAIVVGWVLGLVLLAIGDLSGAALRWSGLLGGIALVGLGSGFYLSAAPTPTADSSIAARTPATGRPVRRCRPVIRPSRGPGPSAAPR